MLLKISLMFSINYSSDLLYSAFCMGGGGGGTILKVGSPDLNSRHEACELFLDRGLCYSTHNV